MTLLPICRKDLYRDFSTISPQWVSSERFRPERYAPAMMERIAMIKAMILAILSFLSFVTDTPPMII